QSFAASTGAEPEQIPIRAGHVVARPPGTRVSHAFRAGPDGLTMLIYGTRKPNDMCWYPRSRKIAWRGLGVIGRIEVLDYYDGEPEDEPKSVSSGSRAPRSTTRSTSTQASPRLSASVTACGLKDC